MADVTHEIWKKLFCGDLAVCPKKSGADRVLEVGTGTGIWAIEYAEKHEGAQVIGVDMSAVQPQWVPPNCSFEVDDAEEEWAWKSKFDFIFARSMIRSKHDWECLQDDLFPVCSDDGTVDGSNLLKWATYIIEATKKMGQSVTVAPQFKQMMEDAGFKGVVEVQHKWPTNHWPRDERYKEVGRWSCVVASEGLEGLSLALFKVLGWTVPETLTFLPEVGKDLRNVRIHGYWRVYTVYGQKPA
ncbi:S-adenosyl-L-methionine-dependent methyltransferase [Lasiosphaeria ovina]|uniref:S-adenosyl-L-methionine-dependent methyltransferase n=1 Tax=Lasiosphaeria ovina TaxID=92902 RepID=A0AAE0MXP0_9PEZI|nr:S-adenosyl-L-methionine-dependent methyltransferase [Lasiosphaeria ovina]